MKIQRVRGTRDFYPEDLAARNHVLDAWRRVSLRNAFVEYDGPILETLDLYRAKSGDELVGQLFAIQSRSDEELAVRPEMTPTLARMINARVQTLPRPIKWFSIGAFYRGERPQRGRLREFYQWNIDIVGSDELLADAECLFVAADALGELGLTADDVVIRINDRRLTAALFTELGIPTDRHGQAYALVDKAERMEPDKLRAAWDEALGDCVGFDRVEPLLAIDSLDALMGSDHPAFGAEPVAQHRRTLAQLFLLLQNFGITEFCSYDMKIVRGLAYYTGCVFEAFDRAGKLRALLGGGRYDSLLEVLGGPSLSGVGFGMGDPVLLELLAELDKLPAARSHLDLFVIAVDDEAQRRALRVVAELRRKGLSADLSYRPRPVGKQLKAADGRGASYALILGEGDRSENAKLKDMKTGQQNDVQLDTLLREPQTYLKPQPNT